MMRARLAFGSGRGACRPGLQRNSSGWTSMTWSDNPASRLEGSFAELADSIAERQFRRDLKRQREAREAVEAGGTDTSGADGSLRSPDHSARPAPRPVRAGLRPRGSQAKALTWCVRARRPASCLLWAARPSLRFIARCSAFRRSSAPSPVTLAPTAEVV